MLPHDSNLISPPQQPALKKWYLIAGIIGIDIDQFRNDLSSIPFAWSPEGTVAEQYDEYMVGVTQVLDKHAAI